MLNNPLSAQTTLLDEIYKLEAQAHGKRIELCQLQGDRQGMQYHLGQMYEAVKARKENAGLAVETADCYFDACGHRDGLEARG